MTAELLATAQQQFKAGSLIDAAQLCHRILHQQPQEFRAFYLLGNIADRIGKCVEASKYYQQVITLAPDCADAYNLLGNALQRQGRFQDAIPCYQQAIALRPSFIQAYNNLGAAYQEIGQYDESVTCYQQAIALKPAYADAYYNLGNTYKSQDNFAAAIAAYRKSIFLKPHYPDAHNNAGLCLYDLGLPELAILEYQQAIALLPEYADAHQNLGLALLLMGHFSEGFQEYEWRWRATGPDNRPPRAFPQPEWDGSELKGKTILLHAEQGLGDTLQFVRYAPLLARRGARVFVECQPALVRLLSLLSGVEKVIAQGSPLPMFDLHAPLMSLPLLMGTTPDTIPAQVPYLHLPSEGMLRSLAPEDDLHHLETLLAIHLNAPDKLRVGLVWAGNPTHRNDRRRSCPLQQFAPLLQIEGVQFYSLQKGARAEELRPWVEQGRVEDLGDRFRDFIDTAIALQSLDLVITVDTSVAHLAGALGKPTWLLLPFAPDWRWMLHREDSPWYPSMRLFRQTSPGDWAGVITRVKEALQIQTHVSKLAESITD